MGQVYRAKDLKTGEYVALKVVAEPQGTQSRASSWKPSCWPASLTRPSCATWPTAPPPTASSTWRWSGWRVKPWRTAWRAGRCASPRPCSSVAAWPRPWPWCTGTASSTAISSGQDFAAAGDRAQAKVLDFGIARRLFDPEQGLRITSVGAALGTPLYMAPEQARGASTVDGRADIFALGCVLFECLTGQPPFAGTSPTAIMAKICLDDPVDLARRRPESRPIWSRWSHACWPRTPPTSGEADEVARALGATAAEFLDRDSDLAAIYRTGTPTPTLVATGEQRILAAILVSRSRAGAVTLSYTIRAGPLTWPVSCLNDSPTPNWAKRAWESAECHRAPRCARRATGWRLAGHCPDRRAAGHAARPGHAGRALCPAPEGRAA